MRIAEEWHRRGRCRGRGERFNLKKFLKIIALLITLASAGVYWFGLYRYTSPQEQGAHWPEDGLLRIFTSVTVHGQFRKDMPDGLLVTPEKFNEILLETCRASFKRYNIFNQFSVEPYDEKKSFQKHPLNLGLEFSLGKNRHSGEIPKTFEITYKFKRHAFVFNNNFPAFKVDYKNSIPSEGRFTHPKYRTNMNLPKTVQEQEALLRTYSIKACDYISTATQPALGKARSIEDDVLEAVQ